MGTDLENLRRDLQDLFESDSDTVLDLLDVQDAERPHTRILQWLFDDEAHGAGYSFLMAFAEELGVEDELNEEDVRIDTFQQPIGPQNAEIDLLIRSANTCIGIEIKTKETERVDKLDKESRALKEHFDYETITLVYLTPDPYEDKWTPQLTWEGLVDLLSVSDADREWHGFLNQLFEHIKTTIMRVERLSDLEEELDKAELYAHMAAYLNEAENDYKKTIRQFITDVRDEIKRRHEGGQESLADLTEGEHPLSANGWDYRLNYDNDFDNRRVDAENLAIYNEEWPREAINGDDELLTVRFVVNIRDLSRTGHTTAQRNKELSTPFGFEINFDIRTDEHGDVEQEVREDFFGQVDEEKLDEREYMRDITNNYHIIGRLFERDWPPGQADVEKAVDELEWLVETVY